MPIPDNAEIFPGKFFQRVPEPERGSELEEEANLEQKTCRPGPGRVTTDLVRLYLQDIGRVPLLKKDEEVQKAQKVQQYINLLDLRQRGALAGDVLLQQFIRIAAVHDRLRSHLCHSPVSYTHLTLPTKRIV